MRYTFLIIDANVTSANKMLALFDNFPKFCCLGIVKDNENAIEVLVKLRPQLVIIRFSENSNSDQLTYSKVHEIFKFFDVIPYFIAISDSSEKALEAIQSGFSDYLVGEISLLKLGESLFKFEKRIPITAEATLCLKSYSDYHFVNLHDIIFLKADNNTVDIQLQSGKIVNAYKTLKHFENSLPFYFLRIHKSYIVNINFVSRIHLSKSKCYLNHNEILPFSLTYRNNIDFIVHKIQLQ